MSKRHKLIELEWQSLDNEFFIRIRVPITEQIYRWLRR